MLNFVLSKNMIMYIGKKPKVKKADSIKNPDNAEFVNEVAFNKGIKPSEVTQEQFNKRYGVATKGSGRKSKRAYIMAGRKMNRKPVSEQPYAKAEKAVAKFVGAR